MSLHWHPNTSGPTQTCSADRFYCKVFPRNVVSRCSKLASKHQTGTAMSSCQLNIPKLITPLTSACVVIMMTLQHQTRWSSTDGCGRRLLTYCKYPWTIPQQLYVHHPFKLFPIFLQRHIVNEGLLQLSNIISAHLWKDASHTADVLMRCLVFWSSYRTPLEIDAIIKRPINSSCLGD